MSDDPSLLRGNGHRPDLKGFLLVSSAFLVKMVMAVVFGGQWSTIAVSSSVV